MVCKRYFKKIRSAYRTKALKGEFTGAYAPYGYKKDPNNKHHLIIDEEEAEVVVMIFELASIGKSAFEISQILKKQEILKPRAKLLKIKNKYYKKCGMNILMIGVLQPLWLWYQTKNILDT